MPVRNKKKYIFLHGKMNFNGLSNRSSFVHSSSGDRFITIYVNICIRNMHNDKYLIYNNIECFVKENISTKVYTKARIHKNIIPTKKSTLNLLQDVLNQI